MDWKFPMAMTIRCYQCGKVFDIAIVDKETHQYPCPACGRAEVIDVSAWERKITAHNEKMGRKMRGGL